MYIHVHVMTNVFCYEYNIQFFVCMCLLKYISSTLKEKIINIDAH